VNLRKHGVGFTEAATESGLHKKKKPSRKTKATWLVMEVQVQYKSGSNEDITHGQGHHETGLHQSAPSGSASPNESGRE
jgi:hypothetical protein